MPPIFSFLIIAAVCWSRSFAGEVQSPPSLEGASLEISARKEEYKNLHHDVFLNLKDGISWEGSEDRIVTYEPKGKNAHIIVVHCDKRKEDYSSGEIYEKKKSLVGDFALYTFSKVTANICFLGVGGINEKGITTYALPETAINRLILERTNGPRIVVAEGSKVGREQNFSTADISLITHLVTDRSADPEEIQKIEAKGVKVLYVTEVNVNGQNEIRIEE